MDKQGQIMIKMRKIKNRAWRYARKKKAPEREIQILKRRYELQQKATSIYLGKRKGDWEKRKVLEARTNSKILWNMSRDISGKTRKKDEITYVYTEDKEKKEIDVIWTQFIGLWKKYIYQKKPRMSLTFWYGSENTIGLKERKIRENIENMNREEGRMIPLPEMKE